jgi:hypothetical protein
VMVLQRLEGLSDREAVERYAFDVRCPVFHGPRPPIRSNPKGGTGNVWKVPQV